MTKEPIPMTTEQRKRIEREIQGLRAKCRWDHITPEAKRDYEARIAMLEEKISIGQWYAGGV